MATELSEIKSNEQMNLAGDVHITGNIGSGAVVTVQDGNLIVDGDVEDGAQIALNQKGKRIWFNQIILTDSDHRLASIKGSVGSNVTINATSADIKIGGNVGENSQIKSFNGDVFASWDVGRNSRLITFNGGVRAHNLDEGANAVTFNGRVDVQSAHQSAVLNTFNGDVYVAGVKLPRPQRATTGSVVVSRRVFVNGREITGDADYTPRESYPGAQLGVVISLVVGLSITMGIGFALAAPILPFLIAIGVVGVACTVIGALIGHAIQRAMSARSAESTVNTPQQAQQFTGSTTKFQKTMGGSTFTFNNEPGSTIMQQTVGGDAVVESPVQEQKEEERRLLKP